MSAIDLFAGPGGWDEGIRELGIQPLGIELDEAACATREAAGHRTLQADVAALDPLDFAPCKLLIGSPPCQAFSAAGKKEGREDVPLILDVARGLARGVDDRAEATASCVDPRSLLVLEPLRWAIALRPEYIALEQVPPVLELWQFFADLLRWRGYRVWTGVLSAEQYGVPQTRRRAILLASSSGQAAPPPPTHQAYTPGEPAAEQWTLEGVLHPWVSMADALGWAGRVGFPRLADDGAATEDGYRERDFRDATEPAFNLTEKARSWTIHTGQMSRQADGPEPYTRDTDAPAPTVLGTVDRWQVKPDRVEERQENGASRDVDEPSPTITSSMDNGNLRWFYDRRQNQGPPEARERVRLVPVDEPAPTLGSAGLATGRDVWVHEHDDSGAKRVELHEAAVLQGFPSGYPFQGSRSKRFEQIGNAVPPPLARAVIGALVADSVELREAA